MHKPLYHILVFLSLMTTPPRSASPCGVKAGPELGSFFVVRQAPCLLYPKDGIVGVFTTFESAVVAKAHSDRFYEEQLVGSLLLIPVLDIVQLRVSEVEVLETRTAWVVAFQGPSYGKVGPVVFVDVKSTYDAAVERMKSARLSGELEVDPGEGMLWIVPCEVDVIQTKPMPFTDLGVHEDFVCTSCGSAPPYCVVRSFVRKTYSMEMLEWIPTDMPSSRSRTSHLEVEDEEGHLTGPPVQRSRNVFWEEEAPLLKRTFMDAVRKSGARGFFMELLCGALPLGSLGVATDMFLTKLPKEMLASELFISLLQPRHMLKQVESVEESPQLRPPRYWCAKCDAENFVEVVRCFTEVLKAVGRLDEAFELRKEVENLIDFR
jgi:hypothetical protein